MGIGALQSVFGGGSGSALTATLPRATLAGNALVVHLRFSPLTGTPNLSDNLGNPYRRLGTVNLSDAAAAGLWLATIERGGFGHTVTATSQGGAQSLEMAVAELACCAPGGEEAPPAATDSLLAKILAQLSEQTSLLQRLVKAERA